MGQLRAEKGGQFTADSPLCVLEDAHARHLLTERAHLVHLGRPFFIRKLSHSKFFHSPPTFPSTENTPAPAFPVQDDGLGAGSRTHAYT